MLAYARKAITIFVLARRNNTLTVGLSNTQKKSNSMEWNVIARAASSAHVARPTTHRAPAHKHCPPLTSARTHDERRFARGNFMKNSALFDMIPPRVL